jgi:antitoxin (DNA-binding transcriptional repressor) of toxin-antitoxin stability system
MQVSIRELKANPSKAIALIRRGAPVDITSHRKVVAQLVAPGTVSAGSEPPDTQTAERLRDEQIVQRLFNSGVIAQRATKPFKLPEPVVFPPDEDGRTMSDIVLDMRGPR